MVVVGDARALRNVGCARHRVGGALMALDATVEEVVASEQGAKTGEQIQQAFELWRKANPLVANDILEHARLLMMGGSPRVSSKYLIEWARYELPARISGVDEYAINSDFSAPLARWLISKDQRLASLIDVRRSKVDGVSA